MRTVPEDYEESAEEFCSNFDGYINYDILLTLQKEKIWAGYPGWYFYGRVWYDKIAKKYCCEVKQYCQHIDTLSSETAEGLKHLVCEKYGYD